MLQIILENQVLVMIWTVDFNRGEIKVVKLLV